MSLLQPQSNSFSEPPGGHRSSQPQEQIRGYLGEVRRRLQWQVAAQGLGICGVIALAATVIIVLLANHWRFSESATTAGSFMLWTTLLAGLGYFLARPLMARITDARIARFIEEKHPEFKDQLVTAVELQQAPVTASSQVFQRILAEEALRKAPAAPAASLVDATRIWKPLTWAAASVAIILLLGLFGPGAFRYGTRTLWIGWAQAKANPLYVIAIKPGDVTVGRDADQEILASPSGFIPSDMKLHVLYGKNTSWETADMQPGDHGPDFHFLLMNIQEPIQYYVESNGVRSPQYTISVIAVPRVQRLEVKFHYPPYSGMEDTTDQAGGDIIALKGTEITLTVHTDAPAPGGRLVLDDNSAIELKPSGEKQLVASFKLTKDAMYHVRLQDPQRREARASEEYIIQAVNDMAPAVRLVRPGRDLQPTPVEEVVIAFEAQDDVRMANLDLNYVVNGKEKKSIALVKNGSKQQVSESHLIALEDYKLKPGDLISYYADAKDAAGNTTTSEMYFLQVRPFERNYVQSQQGGGGGGGGGQQEDSFLSERQKEVISATWNVLRGKEKQRPDQLAEAAEVLSTVQQTVKEQAETLQMRIGRRELNEVNNEFESLTENLKKAVEAMDPAIVLLKEKKFEEALTPEQEALQYLLRAEASYRDIQVAFGQQGGGGGGGGNAGRDLSDLFQLELDTNKNQYETLNQMSNPTGSGMPGQEMDDIMRKLQELARRQQELARRERENQKESMRSANRWEQEMLRRETEELARKLEQLSRQSNSQQMKQAARSLSEAARDMQQANGQQGQQQQNGQQGQQGQQRGQQGGQQTGQQGQQQGQQSGQGGQSGQQSGQQSGEQGSQQNAQNQQGGQQGSQQSGRPGGSERERALERLREATNALANQRSSNEGQRLAEMTNRARDLARLQDEVADKTRQMASRGENKTPGPEERQALSETINNKIEMLEKLRELERDINSAAGRLAGSQRDASSELRGASSHMQDERLNDKIRQGAWLSQRGMWPSAAPVEEELKDNLDELARRLDKAQSEMSQGAGEGDKLARALETAERVRQGLEGLGGQRPGERLDRNGVGQQQGQQPGQQQGNGQRGMQPGQQQSGQQQGQQAGGQQAGGNQQGQQQAGNQPGGQQPGSSGSPMGGQMMGGTRGGPGTAGTYTGRYGGDDYNRGDWQPGQFSPEQLREAEREIGQLSRESLELRGLLADDQAFGRMVSDLIRSMQELDAKNFTGNPAELERLRSELTEKWKELELKLRREMQLGEPEAVRLVGQERVPEKYRSLVEEYYRSLSRKKQ